MKNLFFLIIVAVLCSCNDETLAPTKVVDEMVDMDAILEQTGIFEDGPYGSVTGIASLYKNTDGSYDLTLDDFKSSNGPDLYVYFSKEVMPVHFISLGKLTSTNGNQVYHLGETPDVSEYKYVCIHCKKYNHLFGYAKID